MARRNDHSREELHRMALDAAQSLLDEGGPHALSMRRIAQSIGYTHGTLYLIFSNLDALLAQLNTRTLTGLVNDLQAASDGARGGRDRLLAVARAYVDFASAHTARWRLVFEHHPAPETEPLPEAEAQIQRGFQILADAFETREDMDDGLGAAFWAAVHGVTVLSLDDKLIGATGEDLDATALIARTVDIFLTAAGHSAPGR